MAGRMLRTGSTTSRTPRARGAVRAVVLVLAAAALMVALALPAAAQVDGASYVGPVPPQQIAPEQVEAPPAEVGVEQVAAPAEVAAPTGALPITGGDAYVLAAIGLGAIVVGGVMLRLRHRPA